MTFYEILLRGIVQNYNLLLLLIYGFYQSLSFLFELDYVCIAWVFFCGTIELFFDVFDLFGHEESFRFSFSNFHRINCVLLVKLNQSLLKLNDFLIDNLYFILYFLFLDFISSPRFALALIIIYFGIFLGHYSLRFFLIMLFKL